jgi:hypothetical protein
MNTLAVQLAELWKQVLQVHVEVAAGSGVPRKVGGDSI